MKILGVSFGKVMGNCDILTKQALYGAKAAHPEAEVEFINTVGMKIGRCIGCGACSRALEAGKDNDCIIKDDFQKLENKLREADAIIMAAPVYVLQPVGQFKDFVDRFSCRHDYSAINWVLDKRKTGEMPGNAEDFPADYRFKRRVVSYISVGGATTEHWVSMGCATMHLFGFPPMMKVVANYDAHAMGPIGSPVLREDLMEDLYNMGKATANAYFQKDEDIEWYGPKGTCPVCHQNLLTVNGTTTVNCPICGIYGTVTVEGDKLLVDFSEAEQKRARGTFAGLREHTVEIQGFGAQAVPKIMEAGGFDALKEKLEKYRNFDKYINA